MCGGLQLSYSFSEKVNVMDMSLGLGANQRHPSNIKIVLGKGEGLLHR